MTSFVLPFTPRVSVFDWDYEEDGSDRVGGIYVALVEQRQLIVRKYQRMPPPAAGSKSGGGGGIEEFQVVRLVFIRHLESAATVTSVVHCWLSDSGHFLLNVRANAGGSFHSGLLVFDSQLTLTRTMYFGLTTFPCYCYSDRLFYLPCETENCVKRYSVPDLRLESVLDCGEAGHRYVPQEAKSPFQISVSDSRILLCSFYTVSRRVVLNAYSKEPFQLQAEMRLDFSPMRYVDTGAELIWFEGGPQQHQVKIRFVSIDQGFFVSAQEDSLSLLVPGRFTVPWLGSMWLFANRRARLFVLECPNFDGSSANIGGGGGGRVDCQLCTSIDLHRERRGLFSQKVVRDLVASFNEEEAGENRLFVINHDSLDSPPSADSAEATTAIGQLE